MIVAVKMNQIQLIKQKVLIPNIFQYEALKELEKLNIKPNQIVIPNNKEFKELAKEIRKYKTNLKIRIVNTSALQYLLDNRMDFDFIWLDYCGGYSNYVRDLDVLLSKCHKNMKLVLTYCIFDLQKQDDNYYFTNVIDYVLSKIQNKAKIRLMNEITLKYKKTMYNLGFDIKKFKKEEN